jgi:hypothetical protein
MKIGTEVQELIEAFDAPPQFLPRWPKGKPRGPSPLRKDIAGQRFGRLVAVRYASPGSWEFLCDCGKLHKAKLNHVRYGKTRSCGCLLAESRLRRRPSTSWWQAKFARLMKQATPEERAWALEQLKLWGICGETSAKAG